MLSLSSSSSTIIMIITIASLLSSSSLPSCAFMDIFIFAETHFGNDLESQELDGGTMNQTNILHTNNFAYECERCISKCVNQLSHVYKYCKRQVDMLHLTGRVWVTVDRCLLEGHAHPNWRHDWVLLTLYQPGDLTYCSNANKCLSTLPRRKYVSLHLRFTFVIKLTGWRYHFCVKT